MKHLFILFCVCQVQVMYGQYNEKWQESFSAVFSYSSQIHKAIIAHDTLYFLDHNIRCLRVIPFKTKNYPELKVNANRKFNKYGFPYDIYKERFYNSAATGSIGLDIYQENIHAPNLYGRTGGIQPFTNLHYDALYGYRNCIENISDSDTDFGAYRDLTYCDFFIINDSLIEVFVRDTYRFSWWRYHVPHYQFNDPRSEPNGKWEEIRTYTFEHENSLLFSLPIEDDRLPTKYVYHS